MIQARSRHAIPWLILATICGFSLLAVYASSASLHAKHIATGIDIRKQSLEEYQQALSGTRAFPYQWRLLGVYLVYLGERTTGADPHAVDLVAKVALLSLAACILFLYSRAYMSDTGALAVAALYLVATTTGFTDGYSIYYTSDFAMIAAWFAAVWLVREGRFGAAALATFVGSFAKETMLLVPVLAGFGFLRRSVPLAAAALVAAAFLVPTAFLRWLYPAPLGKWAWWDMLFVNVPFLQSSLSDLLVTLKNNVKVLLLFNVLWILGAAAIWRSSDRFQKDLGLTAVVYLLLAYPVIYIRELRHFLPLAIVILPPAIAAFDRRSSASSSSTTTMAMKTKTNG